MDSDSVLDIPGIATGKQYDERNAKPPRPFNNNQVPFHEPVYGDSQAAQLVSLEWVGTAR